MVERTQGHGERAQLILVGAIAIAFLILGIVVVFNSAIYSQTAGQDGTVERAGEPAAIEQEVEQGIRDVAASVNTYRDTTDEDGDGSDEYDAQGALEENLTGFENHYRNATAASRPVLVDLDIGTVTTGHTVYQHEFTELTDREDNDDGRSLVVGGAEDGDIESFELTLNVSDLESLTVALDESDRTIDLNRENEIVTVSEDGSTCDLEPAGDGDDLVTIDLVTGETDAVADEECLEEHTLNGNEDKIEFEGVSAIGTFELIIGPDPSEEGEVDSDFTIGEAVTSVESQLTYESDELTYERILDIDVYGDEP